ncbi:SDR family NAD(P)-dependent oxidoreductase [Stackebrandtia soli]|uniref:SDR family NAD(P)-dependent oxidoreductase n=1 Tax=Stackebrandtia soli TaxID=1892856 RepID=UPI0039ECEC1B
MTDTPTAVITGAGRGIGRAVALLLSRNGYRVVLTARNVDELTATADECPGAAHIVPGDLTEATTVDRLFDEAADVFSPPSVLVLNAGAASSAPLPAITDEDWAHQLDLNLTAPFRCLRRAVPAMRKAGHGRVVAIASMASKQGEPYIAAYTAAKHGLLGLVRAAAAELANTGVTVNAVCPGYVDTPMTDRSVANIADRTGMSLEKARGILAAKQPIGRLIDVEEVADAVMLCVGTGAITGQGINVDGGTVQS